MDNAIPPADRDSKPVLDVGEASAFDRRHLLESEAAHVVEQPLAVTEHDRDDVQLELVDQPCGQGCWTTLALTEQHVQLAGGLLRLLERGPDPIGTKVKVPPPSPGDARGW
jgi:hypothetical protein